jgi:integrase
VKTKRILRKGENPKWNIILALGRGPDGKHKQKWVRFQGTRQQAELKLSELVGEIHRGEFVEPSKRTLGQWLDEWLEKAIKPPRREPNTYIGYLGTVTNHLKPALGHIALQQLTPLHVERYYVDAAGTLSERTLSIHHCILTSSLEAAVTAGLVRHNAAKRATNKPRTLNSEDVLHNVWNADEASRFIKSVKDSGDKQYATLFALALDSGLRKSELLGLQWKDIDGRTLRVDRQLLSVTVDEATGVVTPVMSLPKGKRARSLDLSDETLQMLREHKRSQAEVKLKNRLNYVDNDLIFAQDWDVRLGNEPNRGAPLGKNAFGTELKKACEAAGVKCISPHGLRHTCATLLLAAGVAPHVVQRRLGHKGVEMTLNLYAHVLPSMQADAASRLALLLHR